MDPQRIQTQETQSVGSKWCIELYPFKNRHPSPNDVLKDESNKSSGVSVISSSDGRVKEIIEQQILQSVFETDPKEDGEYKPNIPIFTGIRTIAFSRSKVSPESEMQFTVVGRIPKDLVCGTWVVATSVSNSNNNPRGKTLTRFIGQISDVQVSYSESQDGNLLTSASVFVREWSYALKIPIKYNEFSLIYEQATKGEVEGINIGLMMKDMSKRSKSSVSDASKEMQDLLSKALDPFEFVHMVLTICGMLNEYDRLKSVESFSEIKQIEKIHEIATTTPSIPENLFKRLGINPTGSRFTAFSNFAKVVTGVQGEPINNRSWTGIFGNIESEYASKLKNNYEKHVKETRPRIAGYSAMSQVSMSAWDMITGLSDEHHNEIFTDMWYEKIGDDVVGRPVIVVRDRPFLLNGMIENEKSKPSTSPSQISLLNTWTKYDWLPRVHIPSSLITDFNVETSSRNSPNWINIVPTPAMYNKDIARASAATIGTAKLMPEMYRFGGQSAEIVTQYLGYLSNDKSITKDMYQLWTYTLRVVNTAWHAYDYRMGRARLVIKDANIPISVGFNVTFDIGKFKVVGHVESVSVQATVGSDGLETTVQSISLSKVVHEYKEDGSLGLIDNINDMFYSDPPMDFGLEASDGSSLKTQDAKGGPFESIMKRLV